MTVGANKTGATPFWGRYPIAWVGFAASVLAIPILALALQAGPAFAEFLPTLNATLNGTSALFLFVGWRAIKAKNTRLHWQAMLAATTTSVLFLTFYLIRFSLTGVHTYPRNDYTRTIYRVVLATHTVLAAMVPFLVGRTLYLAWRRRFDQHRGIARWTLPIWMYVSVTGVVVYLMLYHLAR